ncbi:Outer membrane protein OmpA [Pseudonocardia thermophila]|uniref:Outer membrane protein OmpA n=1 Tax=Pseudonocardia thermophila TaxID=1848 RepID=A0A1M6NNW9_PSETH|nr:Outer membrane protein OmpA [Pseudonocardia thermophila]
MTPVRTANPTCEGTVSESTGDRPAIRTPWLPLGAAALIVPTVLAGITLAWPRPQIEAHLGQRAAEALSAAGIASSGVEFSGRDATIVGVAPGLQEQAQTVVEEVTGVRVAGFLPTGGAAPFGLTETGDSIVLTGTVGSEEERSRLVSAAAAQAGGRSIDDELTVQPGARLPDGINPTTVTAIAAALAGIPGEITVSVSGPTLTLSGQVADEAARSAVAQRIGAAVPGFTLDDRLTVAAPVPTAPTAPAPAPGAPGADLDPATKQTLQTQLSELLAATPISFGPNSPQLTPQGGAAVARVLDLLRAAPGARIQIDGYVAAGPGDGRMTAEELSTARAATVRDALVAGGIPADRITIRGLGEGTNPIPSPSARRVEITVV